MPQVGVYNEQSLQRLDLILAEASANGVRIILPFVNFWADLGGMQWYVDQVGRCASASPNLQPCRSLRCGAGISFCNEFKSIREAQLHGMKLEQSM